MITCTRRLQFAAGHRILGHENKCAHLHGHNYVVLLTAQQHHETLDSLGRVIDFSVLKERVGGWIDDNWDHGFIVFKDDAFRGYLAQHEQKHYVLPTNPTAENMAAHLLDQVCPLVLDNTGVRVVRVRLWETENCYADASSSTPA